MDLGVNNLACGQLTQRIKELSDNYLIRNCSFVYSAKLDAQYLISNPAVPACFR